MTTQTEGQLHADVRTVVGKKVRFIRRSGLTPGNVYGHHLESQAVQLNTEELIHTLRRTQRSALMTLTVAGERAPRPVVIRHLQRHPVEDTILHVDFFQVSMTERMTTSIPLHVIGTSSAVVDLGGLVIQELSTIEIECLPGDIPSSFEIDISNIEALGESLHIRDLVAPENVSILADPDAVVVRIASPAMAVQPTDIVETGEVEEEEPTEE